MKKKKGSAHLEIVTAFTLFIVFTIFLLYFLKAPPSNTLSITVLNKLESSFLNSTETELASFLVKPNQTGGCVKFNISNLSVIGNSSAIASKEIRSGWSSDGSEWIVLDDGRRNSRVEGDILTINAAGINASENDTLEIFISTAISSGSNPCSSANLSAVVGTVTRQKVLSEKKIEEFEGNYTSNYTSLKDSFNLPTDVDFAVISDGFINATRNIPQTDTQSRRILMDVVFSNGTVIKKNIDLIVW